MRMTQMTTKMGAKMALSHPQKMKKQAKLGIRVWMSREQLKPSQVGASSDLLRQDFPMNVSHMKDDRMVFLRGLSNLDAYQKMVQWLDDNLVPSSCFNSCTTG